MAFCEQWDGDGDGDGYEDDGKSLYEFSQIALGWSSNESLNELSVKSCSDSSVVSPLSSIFWLKRSFLLSNCNIVADSFVLLLNPEKDSDGWYWGLFTNQTSMNNNNASFRYDHIKMCDDI